MRRRSEEFWQNAVKGVLEFRQGLKGAHVKSHAIVYGGSMVGLVTAGVLSRHFERVTLVERDRYENGPKPRKGVPQAMQVHSLLTRGLNVFCDVFPGFRRALEEAGGGFLDMAESHAWYAHGAWRPRFHSGMELSCASRPLLEWVTRKQLQTIPNVRVLDGRTITGLLTTADKTRVTGVQLQGAGGEEETLEGDLVVDTSGRGSRLPQWLEALGYPRVEEEQLRVDVVYSGRIYRRPPGFSPGWETLTLSPRLPEERRIGAIMNIEDHRWLVLLGGWLGEGPSPDEASFLEFARGLPQPHLYEAIRNAEPLGPVHQYRFSSNQRRYYERMARFPERLAVAGDAFCSFNPIYGQGMTTGALQASLLGECLREGLDGVSARYLRRTGQLLNGPWGMATGGDLRFPEVEGKRSPLAGVVNWFGDRLQEYLNRDPEALVTFLRVMHMLDSPTALFSPGLLYKVLTSRADPSALEPGPEPLAASRAA
jgi:2-polyprenyl-6-methoxyphenol hydroxylase-like FAD-dependent oxidoreductase